METLLFKTRTLGLLKTLEWLVVVLLAAVFTLRAGETEKPNRSYTQCLASSRRLTSIAFVVDTEQAPEKGGAFVGSTYGLKIDGITCDSKPLLPKYHDIRIDEEGRPILRTINGDLIYVVNTTDRLMYAESVGSDSGEQKIWGYVLPESFREIIIRYRIRYADLSLGKLCVLSVRRVTDEETRSEPNRVVEAPIGGLPP